MSKDSIRTILDRFMGKGVFPHQMAFTLLIPLRNVFLSPGTLVERLELQEDAVVLEVGCGPGYFSRYVARFLRRGKLYLADVQQEMLDYAKKRMERRGLRNVEYQLCDGVTLPFEDGMFDVVFLVAVLGEVEHKVAYLKELHRVLKTDGMLSISEQFGDPDALPRDTVTKMMQQAGFTYYKSYGDEKNFTINFKKRG